MKRFLWTAAAVAVVAAGAAAEEPLLNVDIWIGWDNCYRPMEWTPVTIGITGRLARAFDGLVTVRGPQDEMTNMTVSDTFVLTPGQPQHIPLVTKLAFAADKCEVRIVDRGSNRTVASIKRELFRSGGFGNRQRGLKVVERNDLFIGAVGARPFGLPGLPRYSNCQTSGQSGQVYLASELVRMMPWDWTGYASLDLLILCNLRWEQMTPRQCQALAQWVSNGGKLLVVLGANALPAKHPIRTLLPFSIGKEVQIPLDANTLDDMGAVVDDARPVTVRPLAARPGAVVLAKENLFTEHMLFGRALVGFGQVGVLATDFAALKVRHEDRAAKFWVARIGAMLGDGGSRRGWRGIEFHEGGEADEDDNNLYHHEISPAAQSSNAVLQHLLDIPELRPLHIGWVILLLALLAVLLGPVDYLVLKRMDRQPLTWVTSAACIVLFTVGAYYGVHALRSGEMQVRSVSVLDAIQGQPVTWDTTYAGLFAPRSDEYRLDGLRPDQWWSGTAPIEENLYAYGRKLATREIYCVQRDGSNLPASLPINIWTMQCLMNESPQPQAPIRVRIDPGRDRTTVRVVNLADRPILRGVVYFSDGREKSFDAVAAKDRRILTVPNDARVSSRRRRRARKRRETAYGLPYEYSGHSSFGRDRNAAYLARGVAQRTRGISAYLKHGAAVVQVEYDQSPVGFTVVDKDCTYNHIRLVRVVVLPEEQGET